MFIFQYSKQRGPKVLWICVLYSRNVENYFRDLPGVYPVESYLSRSRKLSTLKLLLASNNRSRAVQIEVELRSQCTQLENSKKTSPLLQKDLVDHQQKLDNLYDKAKEAEKETLGKLSVRCEALSDILKSAAADRNAEEEQSVGLLN